MAAATLTSNGFHGRSLVAIGDLGPQEIEKLLDVAHDLKGKNLSDLTGHQIALVFYEASTRTYNSFVTAVHHLGASVCGFAGASGSSVQKGESLHDTIKMFEAYSDAIVLRHPRDGAARWAADVSSVPVINAGDGKNQHPTQTLLDLYAIKATQGRLEGLSVALVGDLKYGRTVHSLAEAMAMFPNNTLHLAAPPSLEMPHHMIEELRSKGLEVQVHEHLEKVTHEVDILYVTRIQRERMPDEMEYEQVRGAYRLTASLLDGVRPTLRVLHPLPRVDEIAVDVDTTPYAYYFQQAAGGVDVRKALLWLTLKGGS